MASSQKGLGRGLGALFQNETDEQNLNIEPQSLKLSDIIPNPKQPRKHFEPEALEDLAASIKSQGLLQPILVRKVEGASPEYEIVAGERRWRAAKIAGLNEVPVIIRELSDQDTMAIALIENLQREDLNPLEEAIGIQQLKDEFGISQEELARQLGKSRSALANSLRLLNLSDTAQKALRNGAISAGHARALLSFASTEEQDMALKRIQEEKLSVRELEGLAASSKNLKMPEASSARQKVKNLAPASDSSARKQPQSAIIYSLQSQLAESINLPVKISGQETKGKISISYSNKEEFENILKILGLKENA